MYKTWMVQVMRAGDRLRHLGHSVAEWTSAIEEPVAFSVAIPTPKEQFASKDLQSWRAETSAKKSRHAMCNYFTQGLLERNGAVKKTAKAAADVEEEPDFSQM